MNARAWPVLSIIEMTEFSLLLFVIIGRNGMARQGETGFKEGDGFSGFGLRQWEVCHPDPC